MSRPKLLISENFGFHARSRLLSTGEAKQIMAVLLKAKGYRDPATDAQTTAFPVEQPCLVLNIPEATEELSPLKPWEEQWSWFRLKPKLSENWEYLRTWLGTITMGESRRTKLPDECSPFFTSVSLQGDFWDDVWWTVRCLYSGYKMDETWNEDEAKQWGLRKMVETWSTLTGYRKLLATNGSSSRSGWEILIEKAKEPIPKDGPLLRFGMGRGGDNDWFDVPGPREGIIPEFYSCDAQRMQAEMAVALFEAAIFCVFGQDPVPESIAYKPKNEAIPAFREWAVPVFGTPWLQCLGGFANDPANPDDISDDIKNWSLYVVGYFKLVGNRRCLILQKEPGGWRLLLTGKTIINPERHHFLREEIARMAGMTSETLWEPQEAGEGWLGVPG